MRPTWVVSVCVVVAILAALPVGAEDPVFSGPQVGEKLTSFKARGVLDDLAGKDLDLVKQADGKPLALVFVHELTRPSLGTIRTVMNYAAAAHKEGKLVAGVVFLGDDVTALENKLKQARGALPKDVLIGISTDGQEGPGAYGLNRKMTLTVLVAKDSKVTANFPLVQPSAQADAPKIAAAIAQALGQKPPTAKELGLDGATASGRPKAGAPKPGDARQDPNLGPLLRAVIRKDARPDEVDEAAKKLEAYLAKNAAAATQVGQIARRIIDGGVLKNYGTERAREYIQQWAKKYGEEEKKESGKEKGR
jgi:hypothetical protein